MKNISAHTETTGAMYPGYINISEDADGSMVVTVRTAGAQSASFVRLSKEELSGVCAPCVIAETAVVVETAPVSKKVK